MAREHTQYFTRSAQQNLGDTKVLDLTNWQSPKYISDNQGISSLDPAIPAGACHFIEVKTTVNGNVSKCPIYVESSIIRCVSADTAACTSTTATPCPNGGTVSTTDFINMIATFTIGAPQNNIEVTFKYVENGTPKFITKLVNAVGAGPITVYAYDTNQQFNADSILVLYGAEVLA
jgi:hypothetical protein